MTAYLKLYLIVTGSLAALVMLMPWLVIIGFMFLFLPGLLLSLMPTAFLWGIIYAIAFWLLRALFPEMTAGLLAFVALALVVFALPQPSILAAKARLQFHHINPVPAQGLIKPKGHIRIETDSPQWDNANSNRLGTRPYACDSRCMALLFEPGVESVTINMIPRTKGEEYEMLRDGKSVLAENARTYRLVPKADCGDAGLIPDFVRGHFAASREEAKSQEMLWTQKLSSEVCLIGEPAREDYDLMLRMTDRRIGDAPKSAFSFSASPVSINLGEARRGDGTVIYRTVSVWTSALSMPLHIATTGGMENFGFIWGRTSTLRRPPEWEVPYKALDAKLDVARVADPALALDAARKSLVETLVDASATEDAPAFKGIANYLQALSEGKATPQDIDLIEKLIAEPRLHDLEGAWHLPTILHADALQRLRPLITTKLLHPRPGARPDRSLLGQTLAKWPEGSFARLLPEEETLLDDVMLRRGATGLIERLADQKGDGVARLASILEAQMDALNRFDARAKGISPAESDHGYSAHNQVIAACVTALSKLGPVAQGALPRLVALEAKPAFAKVDRREWDRMMVLLGRPATDITKPHNLSGSQEKYQRNLEYFKARYNPERGY